MSAGVKRPFRWKKNRTGRKYLTFSLADQAYGINLLYVREIVGVPSLIPISQAPAYVTGVFSMYDETIPVVDLRKRFGLPAGETTGRTCVIIVEVVRNWKMTCGLLVDGVQEVKSVPPHAISIDFREAPVAGDYLLGAADLESGLKYLLNIYRVLDPEAVPVVETTRALRVV